MIWYPSISHYIDAVCNPSLFFRVLKDMEVVRDGYGKPFFITGSNSVIFKIKYKDNLYYLKCFTKDNPEREESYLKLNEYLSEEDLCSISDFEYLNEELLSFNDDGSSFFVPVVIGKWIKGSPLSKVIRELTFCNMTEILKVITNKFILLSLELLSKKYSHGDIKPDNIIVSENYDLTLIDLDAMYTPNMSRNESIELGTAFYQHPRRDKSHFGKNTDDYSIAIILTSLLAIEEIPGLYSRYSNFDNLIFVPEELLKETSLSALELKEAWRNRPIMLKLLKFIESESPYINNLERVIKAIAKERNLKKFIANIETINLDKYKEISIIRSDTGKFGYSESAGNIILMPVYDDILPFCEDFGAASIDGKWGYVNRQGINLNGFIYDKVSVFKEGMAAVKITDKWGFIDRNMDMVIPLKFDDCNAFCESMAAISIGGLWGYIDKKGRIKIKPTFLFAKKFHNSVAVVKTERGFSVIDKNGNFLTDDVYDIIYETSKDKAEVRKDNLIFTINLIRQK